MFNKSSIQGPRIAAYSKVMILDDGSSIDVSNYGCLPGQGMGKGNFIDGCGGLGGSHAGLGGYPSLQDDANTA